MKDTVNEFLDRIFDFAYEAGDALTCGEIEALADLYRVAGRDTDANKILSPDSSHVIEDAPGDQHYQGAA
jgi:hypothetical protein